MKRFLLDDIRNISGIDCLCRTATEAYIALEKEMFDVYIFDHDLGEVKPGTEGGDVLRWALQNEYINPKGSVFLITQNPVGRDKMRNILVDHGWYNKGLEYVKGT
jgi:hypothetical protein